MSGLEEIAQALRGHGHTCSVDTEADFPYIFFDDYEDVWVSSSLSNCEGAFFEIEDSFTVSTEGKEHNELSAEEAKRFLIKKLFLAREMKSALDEMTSGD